MITKEQTAAIVKEFGAEFGSSDKDAGCTAVQIAIITKRIENLKPHFESHKHDYLSNRGLLKMIGQRRSLLKYIARTDTAGYANVLKELGLRK